MTVNKTTHTAIISTLSIVASIAWGTFYFEGKVREIFNEALKPFVQRIEVLESEQLELKALKPIVKLNEYKISELQEFIKPDGPEIKRWKSK